MKITEIKSNLNVASLQFTKLVVSATDQQEYLQGSVIVNGESCSISMKKTLLDKVKADENFADLAFMPRTQKNQTTDEEFTSYSIYETTVLATI